MTEQASEPIAGACPACGCETMVAGRLIAPHPAAFLPDEVKGLRRVFYIGAQEVRALACSDCGHIELRIAQKPGAAE